MAPGTDGAEVPRASGWRGLWQSRSFTRALVSLGLSAAAVNTCLLYSDLEWEVMTRARGKGLIAAEMWMPLEGVVEGLVRMERVFAWLALGFAAWAFRAGASYGPAWVALMFAGFAVAMSLHVHV